MSMFKWDQDGDGIVTITMDDPNQSANTMNADYIASMRTAVDRLVADHGLVVVGVTGSGGSVHGVHRHSFM